MIHTVFSTWKFTIFNFPYFSSFLHLVPNKKTRRSVWSSYVRTWNAWLKSKVRLSFFKLFPVCNRSISERIPSKCVFLQSLTCLPSCGEWCFSRFLQVGRRQKNTELGWRMCWILSSSWPTWPEWQTLSKVRNVQLTWI